ncbi:tail fiber domain-containing protein [Spirosoma validum]|uniref:Tail fiber domain-containing protein n=1 Tax=Spirosoma validum TaxID=2771355 RepID=A0A927AY09_9BACT|nr:tail fiber domain-containing protein [Spirosoma validum]MBD2751924.1 tail fiber domain-containing protein [Spirosoma validum]
MKSILLLVLSFLLCVTLSYAQVGIGITTPRAFFNVLYGKTVLFGYDTTGTLSSQNIFYPKLIWYGSKGAFRAGGVSGGSETFASWDKNNVGAYSFASGLDTRARGDYTTSMGRTSTANGNNSTAIGNGAQADGENSTAVGNGAWAMGNYSTALGDATQASGEEATAMGLLTVASGNCALAAGNSTHAGGTNATAFGHGTRADGYASTAMGSASSAEGAYSTAMGSNSQASGDISTAMGYLTTASGRASTAMGDETRAIGDYTTAMGSFVSTDGKVGSFAMGDHDPSHSYRSSANNQMMMRFSGGYILYSSGATSQTAAIGLQIAPGGNAWTTISDSTRKENFRSVDGAGFLQKIASMRLGSWNYKGQDAKQYRHYGPMAQDFFTAFGHDALGTIGEDKSINQADFDGVNLIAIQALIKEVQQLKADNQQLRAELKASRQGGQSTQELAKKVARLEALLSTQLDTTSASLKP